MMRERRHLKKTIISRPHDKLSGIAELETTRNPCLALRQQGVRNDDDPVPF